MTSFAEYRETYEYRGDKIYELIYERHKYSLRGKRPEVVVRNLKSIFEHAFAISQERGFFAMSLRDLSRSSRLSIGALYGCINSKNDIPDIACDTIHFLHTELVQQYSEQPLSDALLASYICDRLYLVELWANWFRFLFRENQHLDEESRARIASLEQADHQLIARLINQARGHEVTQGQLLDELLIPRALLWSVNDWCLKNDEYKSDGITVDCYAAALTDLTLTLLK